MSWEWEVLIAIVRLLFLLAPFLNVNKEFGLTGTDLSQAQDFARAGSSRAMLVTFPAQLFFAIMARASNTQCQGVRWVVITIYVVVGLVAAVALFNIPTKYLRGTKDSFICFVSVTTLGVLAQIFGLTRAVAFMCNN